MSDILIQRAHGQSLERACELVALLAEKISDSLGAQPQWENSQQVRFQQMGASGVLSCDPEQLKVQISLGFLLQGMRATVEEKIHSQLDKLLD